MPAKGYRKFTPDELATLQELYPRMTLAEVARHMGYPYHVVLWQRHQLGLTKAFQHRYPLHPMRLTPTQLAYIAGLIDGEGTVSIRRLRGRWKPMIRIANSDPKLIAWLTDTVQGRSIWTERRNETPRQVESYVFHIEGLSHLPLYEAVLPYMVIKQDLMALVVEWATCRREQSRDDRLTPRQLEIICIIQERNIKPFARLRAAQSEGSPFTT